MSSSIATNALSYNLYIEQIATLAVVNTTTVSGVVQGVDPAFNALIPSMLNYAELRIQREVDLLASKTNISTYVMTLGVNTLSISPNDFVTVQTVGILGGAQLIPTTNEFISNVYGDSSFLATPIYFAMYGGDYAAAGANSNNIIFGPYPDHFYPLSITGTQRLTSLYFFANTIQADTHYTFISAYLPDLLVMASMIYISGFQRNFGRQSDDPAMAMSYESQYQVLLTSAIVEEARKKFQGAAWTSMGPATVATPSR